MMIRRRWRAQELDGWSQKWKQCQHHLQTTRCDVSWAQVSSCTLLLKVKSRSQVKENAAVKTQGFILIAAFKWLEYLSHSLTVIDRDKWSHKLRTRQHKLTITPNIPAHLQSCPRIISRSHKSAFVFIHNLNKLRRACWTVEGLPPVCWQDSVPANVARSQQETERSALEWLGTVERHESGWLGPQTKGFDCSSVNLKQMWATWGGPVEFGPFLNGSKIRSKTFQKCDVHSSEIASARDSFRNLNVKITLINSA